MTDSQSNDYSKFEKCSKPVYLPLKKGKERLDLCKRNKTLPDLKLYRVAQQFKNAASRDDHDELINQNRYKVGLPYDGYEFPFFKDQKIEIGTKVENYPARYSGYLKNLYVHVDLIKSAIKDSDTFVGVINKILEGINSAAGDFWDFRLIAPTGKFGEDPCKLAGMKIIDYRFVNTINAGDIFSFKYFDANSILQNMTFNPTLSNAAAIRTMFAQTNHPDKKLQLADTNELLDYKFRDRLFLNSNTATPNINVTRTNRSYSGFRQTMRQLQSLIPYKKRESFQLTTKDSSGNIFVRRLAMPDATDVAKFLLDDGDEENNPRYTGIMPNIQATFTIQGIGGLRTFMLFFVKNLPEPYSEKNVVFRIIDLQELIDAGKWTTIITAGVIPLRGHIKKRFGIL